MIYNFGIIQIFIRDLYSALNLSQTLTENPVDITVRLIWKIQNCSYIHPKKCALYRSEKLMKSTTTLSKLESPILTPRLTKSL